MTKKTYKNKTYKYETIKHLLWMQTEWIIDRYILACGRSGCERAERHIELSTIFVAYKKMISTDNVKRHWWEQMMKIHDATQDFTGRLDEEIGLNIHDEYIDTDKYSRKFFDIFFDIAEKTWIGISDMEED